MKVLLKIFILLILFSGFSIGSYWLIFSQGLLLGAAITLLLLMICSGVLAFSLYGIEKGQLRKIGLSSRMEVAALLILTVYLSSAVAITGFANTAMERRDLAKDYTAVEKTEMLAFSLWNGGAKPATAGNIERNGIIYSYTASTEDEVDKIDAFLEEEKERIADFFGNEEPGELTIVFHDNFDTLSDMSGYEEAMGFYDYHRQEIHIVPDDYLWDSVLLHEYVHYQSHLLARNNGLSDFRLPLWFEEGMADYLAGEDSGWYELEDVEITDFIYLDHDFTFHNSYTDTFDPYIQSFLAVESLVNEYGEEELKTFLTVEDSDEFYEMLEATTGMELADFQETFLDELIAESEAERAQYDAAYAAMDRKDYEESLRIINELKKDASEDDLYHLLWMETDLYLMQDRFGEAIELMEERIEGGDPDSRVDDLTSLAEIYLFSDPEKSLQLIQDAQIFVDDNEDELDMSFTYYDLEAYLEAYELINSETPLEGYKILLDEQLLYYETVIERVTEIVENELPQAG